MSRAQPVLAYGCKAVGCQQTIHAPLLMCSDHWRRVPSALRRQIWAAYHRVQRGDKAALETHRTAVQNAIDAVHAKSLKRLDKANTRTPSLF